MAPMPTKERPTPNRDRPNGSIKVEALKGPSAPAPTDTVELAKSGGAARNYTLYLLGFLGAMIALAAVWLSLR